MRPTTTPRRGDDGGAVLIEFALVLPLLVVVFLGMAEYGTAWNDANRVERAVLSAGRVASNAGDDRSADLVTLQSLQSALGAQDRSTVERVIIYESTAADGAVPRACLDAPTTGNGRHGVTGVCNVYNGQQFAAANASSFGGASSCASSAWDSLWCPTSRDREGDPDKVGVYVEVRYEALTNLLPTGGALVTRHAVYQLEPPAVGS